ncbi:MAG: glycosyltransferase [Patescibacteria group bacterium]
MKLFIGLITYGESSLKYLGSSLAALHNSLDFLPSSDYSVEIFDNSEPGDQRNRDFLAQYYPKYKVIYQNENLGFAKAYNILIRQACQQNAEYFLMMNPDVLLEKESVKILVSALDQDGNLSSVCPKLYRWAFPEKPKEKIIDTCGLILSSGLKFSDLGQGRIDDGSFDDLQILGPSGAAGLFRLDSLKDIAIGEIDKKQYFDERMFMYKEDCDLAYRLFLSGQKSAFIKESIAWHDRSASDPGQGIIAMLKDRKNKSKKVRSWSFVNQHLIFVKYFKKQDLVSKLRIVGSVLLMFVFAGLKEQFLFRQYLNILSKIREK